MTDTTPRTPTAALKFDAWVNRWEGNLHFIDGTTRVYLLDNPRYGQPKQPRYFIVDVNSSAQIGVLHQRFDGGYGGQINTERPIVLRAHTTNDRHGEPRFVINGIKRIGHLPKNPIKLVLTPWPQGQKFQNSVLECKPKQVVS